MARRTPVRTAAKVLLPLGALIVSHATPAADPAPPAADGAQLFATHCGMCHRSAELARDLQSAADLEAARAAMAAFLAGHGRSDAAADAAIIEYLADSRSPMP